MLYPALKLINNQLNNYLQSLHSNGYGAKLGNLAKIADNNSEMNEAIIISLINVEEEKALKNGSTYRIENKKTVYHNPVIHLNLYLLIAATHIKYEHALKMLSYTALFFQGKNVFNASNSPEYKSVQLSFDNDESQYKREQLSENFKLIMDLYSPDFQESMNIWTSLGGKHLPSLWYKVRLVEVFRNMPLNEGVIISDVDNSNEINFGKSINN